MIKSLYAFLTRLSVPFLLLRLLWRSRKQPAYRHRLLQRLGFAAGPEKKQGIWLHTVSVGEFLAAKSFIDKILEQFPQFSLTITTMTSTGSDEVQKAYQGRVTHLYLPYDTPGAMRRFLNTVSPVVAVIFETELWFNCFHCCRQKRIPVLVMNARLSAKSAAGYLRFPRFSQQLCEAITHLAAQTVEDKQRFMQLGLAENRLSVVGNVKYDVTVDAQQVAAGQALRQQLGAERPVWIAASTRRGEEQRVLAIYKNLKKSLPDLCLLLVPRHPDRFQEVADLLDTQTLLQSKRKTQLVEKQCYSTVDIVLGDSMGELMMYYAAADVALVAGNLQPLGGHNPIEPVALQVPVVVGAHTFNFAAVTAKLLQAGGLKQAHNDERLQEYLCELLSDKARRQQQAAAAYQVFTASQGAVDRLVERLQCYLP